MASHKFHISISPQQNLMLTKALTTDDPEIMKVVNNFFELSKKKGDGGQTSGSRLVILAAHGLSSLLDQHRYRNTAITTQSPPPFYGATNEQPDEDIDFDVAVESDMKIEFIEEEL